MIHRRSFLLFFCASIALSSESSLAEPDQSANLEQTEKIEVTGSHIKRIDVEGASPVQTITRKDIEKTGYNSVGDVVRDSVGNSFGSARERSGSNAAGNAEVNLRGLGSSNTLVLLNGQRLPTDAVTGAVDLNLIPIAAVERVEILKDGASAIYGSDALGGVVNIITRKDFSGNEVSVTQSLPQSKGGAKTELSLVNGINGEKWNMVNVVQFRNNLRVNSRDREWTDHNMSMTGDPGSYRNSGAQWNVDPNCPADRIQFTPQGSFCTYRTSDTSTELPALQQLSVLSETNYQASSALKLTARVGATRRLVHWSYAPAPGNFTIPSAIAGTLGPGGGALPGTTPGQDLNVRYRLTDLGTRDAEVTATSYNALVGADLRLGGSWSLKTTVSHNKISSKDEGVNGYALTADINAAIASGAYNPFAPAGSKGSLESARYVPVEQTTSQLSSVETQASGEIAQLPAGAVSMAVGALALYQKYEDKFDERSVNDEVFGNAGSSGGGQRNAQALYTELSLPATSQIELQAAGRYDHYSDFGSTFNPKGSILFHATKDLLFRSSLGTGFKAPLMQQLHAASSNSYETFIDKVSCSAEQTAGGSTPSCLPQQYQVQSGGNSGLKQETSTAFNAGTVFQATPELSLGADFFMVKANNVVGIDYGDLTAAEKAGLNVGANGVQVIRDAQGYIDHIDAPLQNLSAQQVSGLDYSVAYKMGRFRISIDQSQLFYFKEEGFPGMGMRNKLGENGKPKWRNMTTIAFVPVDHQSVSLTALTIGAHEKEVAEQGNLNRYTSFDAQYVIGTSSGEFTLGIKNILGTTPPLDDSNPTRPLDDSLYDQIGRQIMAGYKVKF